MVAFVFLFLMNVAFILHMTITALLCFPIHAVESVKPKPMCISSNPASDHCDLRGDIRVVGNSSSIFVVSSDQTVLAGRSSWRIKPYPRKGNEFSLADVREWTIRMVGNQDKAPTCTQTHDVPAVVFSLGGFSYNLFHDFTDLLIPLFTATRRFSREVHFLGTNYTSNWISKYRAILKRLSRYPIVNIDKEQETRCYRSVLVGLDRRRVLDIDPSESPEHITIKDFRQFIRSTYTLTRSKAIKLKDGDGRKPRLMIISRHKRRKWRNVNEISEMAQKLGFVVAVGEAKRESNVSTFARLVNSCDVLMGIHGAGLANMVFLPDGAVVIQVIPLGGLEPFAREAFGVPTKNMNLRYLGYKIEVNESSLMERYKVDDPVIRDPFSVHEQGWGAIQATYLDKQDVTLNVTRFRPTLVKALDLLH